MNTSITAVIRQLLLGMFVSVAVAGCATGPSSMAEKVVPFDPQKRAIERSTARWKALTDKRFDEAFGFLSDASKVGISAGEYGAVMQRLGYSSADVQSASCEEAVCTVRSTITLPIFVRAVGARPQTIPVEERWIVNNGELWLIRR